MSKLVSQTLDVLKVTSKTIKGFTTAHDNAITAEMSADLTNRIISVQTLVLAIQQEQSAFIAKITELEKMVSDYNKWETEKQRYQMKKLEPGIFVFSLKEGDNSGEPAHNICADCYQKGQKSLLHVTSHGNGRTHWKCHACGFDESSGKADLPNVNIEHGSGWV